MTDPKKPFIIVPPAYQKAPEEISLSARKINVLAPKTPSKEITPSQGVFHLGIELTKDVNGIGMGVLSDGTPYLNQRGLAALCGVQNAHIGTISAQWDDDEKPRIKTIRSNLAKAGFTSAAAHIELIHGGQLQYCYPAEICLSILEYYAFDAGANCQPEARDNFRLLAGSKLREMIYSQVGFDPAHLKRFDKWQQRMPLHYHSDAKDIFSCFIEH